MGYIAAWLNLHNLSPTPSFFAPTKNGIRKVSKKGTKRHDKEYESKEPLLGDDVAYPAKP